jgi:hypothetical protein
LVCREYHHDVKRTKRYGGKFLARMVGMADLRGRDNHGQPLYKKESKRGARRIGERINQGEPRSGYPVCQETGILCDYIFMRFDSSQYLVLVTKEKHYV